MLSAMLLDEVDGCHSPYDDCDENLLYISLLNLSPARKEVINIYETDISKSRFTKRH